MCGERVALDLDGPAVLALPAHRAQVALEHRHVVPLAPRRQREHQPADAAAGHQHPRLPPRRGRLRDGRVGGPHCRRAPTARPRPPAQAPLLRVRGRRDRVRVLRLLVAQEERREVRLGGGSRREQRHPRRQLARSLTTNKVRSGRGIGGADEAVGWASQQVFLCFQF
jgi:hypothetical protein